MWSIPACAGQPCLYVVHNPLRKVYPRVCGAASQLATHQLLIRGLSPRVRGSLCVALQQRFGPRSIPACAGQPLHSSMNAWAVEVYPRVCGAAFFDAEETDEQQGLSPRVRGSPHDKRAVWISQGSIPACAGQPIPAYIPLHARRVYPRVCGAAGTRTAQRALGPGLSPRVRGSLLNTIVTLITSRSIPACAGQPARQTRRLDKPGVYPRVCGAAHPCLYPASCPAGLSPRVRGSRYTDGATRPRPGSIPACAGQPAKHDCYAHYQQVYPRVCGAAGPWCECSPCVQGLSPRVRGSLKAARDWLNHRRSIPACAGQPIHRATS